MKRFRNRIQIDFDVDEEAMDCMIPKITLQPLIENAIIHGISEKEGGKGIICVKGGIVSGRLCLRSRTMESACKGKGATAKAAVTA